MVQSVHSPWSLWSLCAFYTDYLPLWSIVIIVHIHLWLITSRQFVVSHCACSVTHSTFPDESNFPHLPVLIYRKYLLVEFLGALGQREPVRLEQFPHLDKFRVPLNLLALTVLKQEVMFMLIHDILGPWKRTPFDNVIPVFQRLTPHPGRRDGNRREGCFFLNCVVRHGIILLTDCNDWTKNVSGRQH